MSDIARSGDLSTYLEQRLLSALTAIENHDPERIRFNPQEAADYVIDRHSPAPIYIHWDETSRTEPQESSLLVHEFGERYTVPGQRLAFFVPASGMTDLTKYRGTTRSLSGGPSVTVDREELRFSIEAQKLDANAVAAQLAAIKDHVDKHVAWVNRDLVAWPPRLRREVEAIAQRRKLALDEACAFNTAFDVPVRTAANGRQVHVPVERKTVRVAEQRSIGATDDTREPKIAEAVYEDVVRTIRSVGNAFERLPKTARRFEEEELRDVLLFILNSNYEGAARGEVFNGAGKTDILINYRDRNVFIGECKVWRGAKQFGEAIDQLSDYAVWRDTKAALILFIRSANASEVVRRADAEVRSHPSFVSARAGAEPDLRSNYLMHAKDDASRLIRLALLPVVIRADEPTV